MRKKRREEQGEAEATDQEGIRREHIKAHVEIRREHVRRGMCVALLGLALVPLLFNQVFNSSHARQPGSTTDLKDPFSTALRQHQKHAVESFNSTQVSTVPHTQQRERESNKSAARASLGLEATCEQLLLLRQVLQVAADNILKALSGCCYYLKRLLPIP
jgi:hypothetical protein